MFGQRAQNEKQQQLAAERAKQGIEEPKKAISRQATDSSESLKWRRENLAVSAAAIGSSNIRRRR